MATSVPPKHNTKPQNKRRESLEDCQRNYISQSLFVYTTKLPTINRKKKKAEKVMKNMNRNPKQKPIQSLKTYRTKINFANQTDHNETASPHLLIKLMRFPFEDNAYA